MNGFSRVQEVASSAHRGQGRSNLLANQSGLANSADDDAAPRFEQNFCCLEEFLAEPVGQQQERLAFGPDDVAPQAKLLEGTERIGRKAGSSGHFVILDGG